MRLIRGNKGTSLIEVLVVMVVLMVGILTVVRLFPPGFSSVRRAESMTFASRLAQFEMERWKNNTGNLPEGILPIGLVNGRLEYLNNVNPGPPIDDTNSSCYRRVIGETTRIPFGGWSTGPESGSNYMLSFSPIDVVTPSIDPPLVVRGGNLSRREVDSNTDQQPWVWLKPYQYAIDYDASKISFLAYNRERTFHLACSWWETPSGGGDPVLNTATDIPCIVTPEMSNTWLPISPTVISGEGFKIPVSYGATYVGLDHYSDTVSRGFRPLQLPEKWSDDPYEFKLVDSVQGIISFNPLGYAQTEFGKSLVAKINYTILDPQIIREDKRVPAREVYDALDRPYQIALTLNRIKETGQTLNEDGTVYAGIGPLIGSPVPMDALAIDLQTLRQVDPTQVQFEVGNNKDGYKDGIVSLMPDTSGTIRLLARPKTDPQDRSDNSGSIVAVKPAGRNIRFFYKAEGDWSIQFRKAYATYERSDAQAIDYRHYRISPSKQNRLLLASCNTNDAVSVDYEYTDLLGRTKKVVGESHRLSDVLENVANGKAAPGQRYRGMTYVDLNVNVDKGEQVTRIFSVTGASTLARVLWKDGGTWRRVELDSSFGSAPTD